MRDPTWSRGLVEDASDWEWRIGVSEGTETIGHGVSQAGKNRFDVVHMVVPVG